MMSCEVQEFKSSRVQGFKGLGVEKSKLSNSTTLQLYNYLHLLVRLSVHLFTYLLLVTSAYAAFEFRETGARAVGLSGAFTAQSADANSPFWNPAGLRLVPQVEVTSFYSQLFSLGDLAYLGSAFAVPTPLGGVGIAFTQFGPSDFREHQFYVSHGIELIDNVYAGYNLKGMFLRIEEYGSASTFGFDAGVLARVTEDLNVAMLGKNVNRPTIGASKESLPTGFVAGVAYRPIKGFWLTGDFERIDPNPVSLKTGIEFMLAQYFTLRAGVQNSPVQFSGGFGAKAGIVRLDYAYVNHSSLPGSHQFSLSFKFGEPKEEVYKLKESASRKGRKVSEVSETEEKRLKVYPVPTLKGKEKFTGKLNLSAATVEDLSEIEDIGLVTAKKIVDYRDKYGIIKMDDLLNVPGMRRDTFNALKQYTYIQVAPSAVGGKKVEEEIPPLLEEVTPSTTPTPSPHPKEVIQEKGKEVPPERELLLEPEEYEKLPVVPSKETEIQGEGRRAEGEEEKLPVKEETQPLLKTEEEMKEPSEPKLNLNEINSEELSDLGLSSVQVKNILRYRQKKGVVKSLEELKKLPGIDAKTFEKLKENLEVK